METPKRKRLLLDHVQKTAIVNFASENPKNSHQQIANHFSALWDLPIKRRTVGDIVANISLQESEVDTTCTPPRKRHRSAQHTDMESALFVWFTNTRAQNIPVTDEILKIKAKRFGDELGITDFQYSNGWLLRFKTRHEIASKIISGESAGIDKKLIDDGRSKAIEAMESYDLDNVFNVDETGLYYKMLPDRSLCTADSTKGIKKSKDRVTVSLCCNATGTIKLKPFVIGKSRTPRCFKNFSVKLYCDYAHNKKAWMNSILFDDWLKSFNRQMKRMRRQVLLIMDNAPCHIIPPLSNTKVHFLPPTTTSHLQPLDAGIIQSFKARYRKYQLNRLVDCIDRKESATVLLNTAIRYVKMAWDEVSTETIKNCWKHSGLVPRSDHDNVLSVDDSPDNHDDLARLLTRVQDDLDLDPDLRLTVRQFVDADKQTEITEVQTESDIIDSVTSFDDSETDLNTDDDDDEPPHIPSGTEAKAAIETVMRFLETSDKTTELEIDSCRIISKKISEIITDNMRQKHISDFFTKLQKQ
ncbi:tigger transposable element-derived protein 6-like [Pecten maximus]|uniref:tigger transposable element-derived protein 6-like n=1 Tax=Pecten maximus TaxID=6579 RepID=UPI001458AE32|nr:tigger transposable element-derived protein 6-like [Pecten maximus]